MRRWRHGREPEPEPLGARQPDPKSLAEPIALAKPFERSAKPCSGPNLGRDARQVHGRSPKPT